MVPFLLEKDRQASLDDCTRIENQDMPHRARGCGRAKWGVMTHYLADWKARELGPPMTVEKWNEVVDHFDVEGLAEQLKSGRRGATTSSPLAKTLVTTCLR